VHRAHVSGGETAGVNKQQVRRLHRVASLQLQRDLGLRVDVPADHTEAPGAVPAQGAGGGTASAAGLAGGSVRGVDEQQQRRRAPGEDAER
jgi:hypothetical protein